MPSPCASVLLGDLQVVQPEPVAVQRRLPGGHAVPDLDPGPGPRPLAVTRVRARLRRRTPASTARTAAQGPRDGGQQEVRVTPGYDGPAGRGERAVDLGAGLDLGQRRAVAGAVERPDPRRSLGGVQTGVADRQAGVRALDQPALEHRHRAQHPVAEPLGLEAREERERVLLGVPGGHPVPDRRARRHRLARDDVGDRDLDRGTRLGCDDAPAVTPRRTHAEDVGHRRSAARSGLAAEHPADHDALPDDVRSQQVIAHVAGSRCRNPCRGY